MPEPITSTRVIGTVVCLPSRNLDTSLRFYGKVFDLPALVVEDGMFTVELPNLSLFVMEEREFGTYAGKAGRVAAFPGRESSVILSCAVRSREILDGMLEAATGEGGTVVDEAHFDEEMGLYLGYCLDPDGHHWELAYSGRRNP